MADAREVRHFRRRHRLTDHTVLFVGPYTEEGRLRAFLEAGLVLREAVEDLVVAAIPEGAVDARYRDACERRALAFGHRAIVEWQATDEERQLWAAAAATVCGPGDLAGDPSEIAAGLARRLATAGDSVLIRT